MSADDAGHCTSQATLIKAELPKTLTSTKDEMTRAVGPAHLLPVLHSSEVLALAHVQEGDYIAVADRRQHMGIRHIPAQENVDAGGGESQRALV